MKRKIEPQLRYGRFDLYTVSKGKVNFEGYVTTYLQALQFVEENFNGKA